MSISKLIPLIADNVNKARGGYFDKLSGQWVNGGLSHAQCQSLTKEFLDAAPHKLAAETQLNLSLFGKFSVLDEARPETHKGIHISFRPAPRLTRLIEETPTSKTTSLMKEVSEEFGITQATATEMFDSIQQEICAALVKKGDFTIQQLGTFLITNEETSESLTTKVRFRPKSYLKNLLATLTDPQVDTMVAARKDKRANRKKTAVSSGTLDRKRLARVRKLLHSRDPKNVSMAMLVLEQIALPEDYFAVFETSGLMERLLRSDSRVVVDAAAQIAVAAKNESVFDRFCEMIGLKSTAVEPIAYPTAKCPECGNELETNLAKQCLECGADWHWRAASHDSQLVSAETAKASTCLDIYRREWISSSAVEEFLGDIRNKTLERISMKRLSNLTYLRLIGLSQLSVVELDLGITAIHLEDLPALEQADIIAPDLVELSFSGMENLKQLKLSCSISSLPKEIVDMCALEELGLAGTPLKTLPDSIGQLSQLKILNLSGSGLTNLPDSIGQLSELESLDLSGSGLTHLPESIGGLTSLTSLDLSSTCLVNIPKAIGQLSSLQHLILPTTIERIPHEFGRLSALKTMCFGHERAWQSDEPGAMANMRIIFDLCRQLEGAVEG